MPRLDALNASMEERADRLHAAMSTTFEGFFGILENADFERRVGHARLLFPAVPWRLFNGVVVESAPTAGVADSIAEVEGRGVPCGVQVREGDIQDIEDEVARLGFTERTPFPGLTAAPDEFVDAPMSDLEIVHAQDEAGLEAAADVAGGHAGRIDITRELFPPGILRLPEMRVYVGFFQGEGVTAGIGYQTGRDVAIFNVVTPPGHRRRGYGAAITAHAVREGFANGADLAWLQASELGESVYRRLGFRHTVMYFMLSRPREGA
jgi:ribosomal protein S18 acetylase RimI-like enzyme